MKKKNLKSLTLNKKSISNFHLTVGGGTFSCESNDITKCGICPVPSERGNCLTHTGCHVETENCLTLDVHDPVCFSFRVCL